MTYLMTFKNFDRVGLPNFPKSYRHILRGSRKFTIIFPINVHDGFGMALILHNAVSRFCIPQNCEFVHAYCNNCASLLIPLRRANHPLMFLKYVDDIPLVVPNPSNSIWRSRHHLVSFTLACELGGLTFQYMEVMSTLLPPILSLKCGITVLILKSLAWLISKSRPYWSAPLKG